MGYNRRKAKGDKNIMQPSDKANEPTLLSFWGIGDLHFHALPAWHTVHTQRLAPMFQDLHALWQQEGVPDFCVSPGDLGETYALEAWMLAKSTLESHLGDIAFYPGVGNHEYFNPDGARLADLAETYIATWNKPLRYSWTKHGITNIMLDYPGPSTLEDPVQLYISQETLSFLDEELTKIPATKPVMIFLHSPLSNTVLDRDPVLHLDYNSLSS